MRIIIEQTGSHRRNTITLSSKSAMYLDDACLFRVEGSDGILVCVTLTEKDLKQIRRRFKKINKANEETTH
jgi:hypothetical protein